jgi:uncharacterized SAM-binding protein YcdF (DUF218 family)
MFRKRDQHVWLLVIGVTLLALMFLFRRPILVEIGRFPVVGHPLQPSDLVATIAGTLPEIHYSTDLYHQQMGRKLLFIGSHPVVLAVMNAEPFVVAEKRWDELAGHLAVNAGVPREEILFTDAFFDSTYLRVAAILEVVRQQQMTSVIIVSDPLHTRRIVQSAYALVGAEPVRVLVAPTPAAYYPAPYRFHPENWWQSERELKEVFGEYIKLAFYLIKRQ